VAEAVAAEVTEEAVEVEGESNPPESSVQLRRVCPFCCCCVPKTASRLLIRHAHLSHTQLMHRSGVAGSYLSVLLLDLSLCSLTVSNRIPFVTHSCKLTGCHLAYLKSPAVHHEVEAEVVLVDEVESTRVAEVAGAEVGLGEAVGVVVAAVG